jgi:hypothetical protein
MQQFVQTESHPMNTPNGPEHHVDAADKRASIERRRDALRRIGRSGAAVGAASPLAALAGSGRQWATKKGSTTKVNASVSGCNSVLMSAQPTKQTYGKPCTHYGSSSNLPAGCTGNGKFRDYFTCSTGTKDSNGVTYDPYNNNGCLFHKTITSLCTNHTSKLETVWITAYCNAAGLSPTCKFPYTTGEVKILWTSDTATRSSAHDFFKNYMQNA